MKEPCILTKEPCILTKEPYVITEELYILMKEPYDTCTRDPLTLFAALRSKIAPAIRAQLSGMSEPCNTPTRGGFRSRGRMPGRGVSSRSIRAQLSGMSEPCNTLTRGGASWHFLLPSGMPSATSLIKEPCNTPTRGLLTLFAALRCAVQALYH